jgi:hypothetical protein
MLSVFLGLTMRLKQVILKLSNSTPISEPIC